MMPTLEKEASLLRQTFNYDAQILDASTVRNQFVGDTEAAGAMHEPEGSGSMRKTGLWLPKKARALGVKVHPGSPVIDWNTRNGVHYLTTPGGIVKAAAVGMATGGYTSQGLHASTKNRLLPILSNSIVTRPLTNAELDACNFKTHQVLTDTSIEALLSSFTRQSRSNR